MTDTQRLRGIKLLHTAVWAVVAGAIFALYPAITLDAPAAFGWLHGIIGAEILALALFRWKCPLTYLAERYTSERSPNFDIYLPRGLARWNKEIFTVILVAAWVMAGVRWL